MSIYSEELEYKRFKQSYNGEKPLIKRYKRRFKIQKYYLLPYYAII